MDAPEDRFRQFLEQVRNPRLVALAEKLLAEGYPLIKGHDNRLGPTIPGKNRVVYFTVRQSGEATVWQYSRFDGDIRYWKHQLGHIEIEEKKVRKHGKMETSLQFQLTTDVHFAKWEELFITP